MNNKLKLIGLLAGTAISPAAIAAQQCTAPPNHAVLFAVREDKHSNKLGTAIPLITHDTTGAYRGTIYVYPSDAVVEVTDDLGGGVRAKGDSTSSLMTYDKERNRSFIPVKDALEWMHKHKKHSLNMYLHTAIEQGKLYDRDRVQREPLCNHEGILTVAEASTGPSKADLARAKKDSVTDARLSNLEGKGSNDSTIARLQRDANEYKARLDAIEGKVNDGASKDDLAALQRKYDQVKDSLDTMRDKRGHDRGLVDLGTSRMRTFAAIGASADLESQSTTVTYTDVPANWPVKTTPMNVHAPFLGLNLTLGGHTDDGRAWYLFQGDARALQNGTVEYVKVTGNPAMQRYDTATVTNALLGGQDIALSAAGRVPVGENVGIEGSAGLRFTSTHWPDGSNPSSTRIPLSLGVSVPTGKEIVLALGGQYVHTSGEANGNGDKVGGYGALRVGEWARGDDHEVQARFGYLTGQRNPQLGFKTQEVTFGLDATVDLGHKISLQGGLDTYIKRDPSSTDGTRFYARFIYGKGKHKHRS